MNLQEQARHLNSIIKFHQNLLREVRYGGRLTIPIPRDDGGEDVPIRTPHDLAHLPIGTRISVWRQELRVVPGGLAYHRHEGIVYTFEGFWDELITCTAFPPRDAAAMPRITHMPERN